MNDNSREYWNGPDAKDYPNVLRISGKEYWEPGERQRQLIGEQIHKMGWMNEGEKLDLGAGPSTKWIFGLQETVKNVWAVDFSPQLIEKSGVPQERRIVDDLRTVNFSDEWNGKFVLATAILLFRYLNQLQRNNLMAQVKKTLSHNGRLVVIDFENLGRENLSQEIGEIEKFDTRVTEETFRELGYIDIEKGRWNLVFEGGGGDLVPFSIDWVTAVNP
jgi:hypothetical protein